MTTYSINLSPAYSVVFIILILSVSLFLLGKVGALTVLDEQVIQRLINLYKRIKTESEDKPNDTTNPNV